MGSSGFIRFTLWTLISTLPLLVLSTPSHAVTQVGSDFDNYLQVIWGLVVVIGVILILYGILKKRFSLLNSSTLQEINVLEIKPLMGKKSLCLVNVRGKEFLLGISGENISHLASLSATTKESFAEVLQASSEKSQS